MTITWKQFKEHVESKLREDHIPEDIEIEYIDFSWIHSVDDLYMEIEDYSSGKMLTIS